MSRRTSSEHYIGSLREAKRAAYMAGAEASLDLFMKIADQTVKKVRSDPELDAAAKTEVNTMLMTLANSLYKRVISEVMVATPFEPPPPVTEREPGTAERE